MPVNLTLDAAISWSGGGGGVSIPLCVCVWGLPLCQFCAGHLDAATSWGVGRVGGVNPFVSSSVPVNFTLPLVGGGGWGSPFGQLLDGPLDTTVPQVAGLSPLCGVLASSVDFAECP